MRISQLTSSNLHLMLKCSVKPYDTEARDRKAKRRAEKKEQRKQRRKEDKELKRQEKAAKKDKEERKAARKAKKEARPPKGKKGGASLTGKVREMVQSFTDNQAIIKACKGLGEEKRIKQVIRKVKRSGKVTEKGGKFKVAL